MSEQSKFTPAPWYPIDICGWQHIHSEPYYDALDLLNDEECPLAKANVKLACAAPDLLEACNYALNKIYILENTDKGVRSDLMIDLLKMKYSIESAINKTTS